MLQKLTNDELNALARLRTKLEATVNTIKVVQESGTLVETTHKALREKVDALSDELDSFEDRFLTSPVKPEKLALEKAVEEVENFHNIAVDRSTVQEMNIYHQWIALATDKDGNAIVAIGQQSGIAEMFSLYEASIIRDWLMRHRE